MSAQENPASADIVREATSRPKHPRRKLIIAAAGAAVLLAGGGGYALLGGGEAEAAVESGHGSADTKFVDVPPMIVNLRSPDGAARFIKLHFMLVPGPNGTPEGLKERLPLLLDAYQPFLRELRPEDLAGSAAVFRIKEEMLVRATQTLGAGQVEDVLIQNLVQQ